jgi:two-component system OmpR family sensor kinase
VLKSWDTDLLASEKKTLFNFLALYSFFTAVIIAFIAILYFNFQKDLMLQEKRAILQEYANTLILHLKDLHINFDKYQTYPRFLDFDSAIYDSDAKKIFSTLQNETVDLNKLLYLSDEKIHFISRPESYYLGSKYVVVSIPVDAKWMRQTYKNIAIFASSGLVFMLVFGYFLLRLLLKPMKNALYLLDNFIKDTTHELNTPISAILTNIETIRLDNLDTKQQTKLRRIQTASKTIANLYRDLTYLTLNHQIVSYDETVALKELLIERIEYFKTLLEAKKITLETDLSDAQICMDRLKITKLIDNLLSNAIKYNKINGSIHITLENNMLCISDTGIGIDPSKLKAIFTRYKRFNQSEGGFGIGLSIVSIIAKEYDIKIDIQSTPQIGTKVTLSWDD